MTDFNSTIFLEGPLSQDVSQSRGDRTARNLGRIWVSHRCL